MNTFLIGSKDLFENIKVMIALLADSIDIELEFSYKMVELESRKITYKLNLDIKYPEQLVLGSTLDKYQIDQWVDHGIKSILINNDINFIIDELKSLEKRLYLKSNLLYVEIPLKKLEKSLEDFKKLSILLFKKLDFL